MTERAGEIPLEQRLAEIAAATPGLTERINRGGEGVTQLMVALPYNASITGNFSEESKVVEITYFLVPRELRKRGIGTRLMKSLVAESVARGAETLQEYIESTAALALNMKVFGQENLRYLLGVGEKRKWMAPAAAQIKLEENYGLDTSVDLTQIDTADWERPQPAEIEPSIDFS